MAQWWTMLDLLQQITFVIACATTLFMVGQIIMMLVGVGDLDIDTDASVDMPVGDDMGSVFDGGGADVDVDAGGGHAFLPFGLKIFTVRSLVAFFCIGSWVAFTVGYGLDWRWALLIGIAAGLAAGLLMAYIMNALMKLQSSGNIDVHNCVGSVGEVYLPIPARRGDAGKITVTVQEKFVEVIALTDSDDELKTGTQVKILEVVDDDKVLVEPVDEGTVLSEN